MASLQKNVAGQIVFFGMTSASTGAADTGATVTVKVTKDSGAQASGGGTVTNLGGGQYSYAPTQAETNATAIGLFFTATGDILVNYTIWTDPGVILTAGTGSNQISLASGLVTVGTNNDKTGYSLSQAFPTNFSSLAITAGGAVTVGTNSDKTGYSLSQSFPSNFSSLAITVGGAVTVGTNSDKTGYALTSGERTSVADAILDRDMSVGTDSGSPTVRTVRQALRFLRNKWAVATGTLTVYKEDDATSSWTATVSTDGAAQPIVGNDPA